MPGPWARRRTRQRLADLAGILRNRCPGQLILQVTDRCNARCPQCGMRRDRRFPRSRLGSDDVKRMLDAAVERGIRVVSFTGGEPFLLLDELADWISYAGRAGMEYIRTGTNGFFFRDPDRADFLPRVERIVEILAATPLRNLWISLDSADPGVHEAMRGLPGVVRGIEKALPLFHRAGIYPAANLGINRNLGGGGEHRLPVLDPAGNGTGTVRFEQACREGLSRFYEQVIRLGFTTVNLCYPMSIGEPEITDGLDPVYAASSVEAVVSFNRLEKAALFRTLLATLPDYRARVRIFTPRASLLALLRQHAQEAEAPYPCRGGIDFLFVRARDGRTFPCGYRGNEDMGPFLAGTLPRPADPAPCRRCDWECFRDPSELLGPLLQAGSDPLGLLRRLGRDPAYFRLWQEDLRYYRACDFFDGRTPPNRNRLRRFAGARGVPAAGDLAGPVGTAAAEPALTRS